MMFKSVNTWIIIDLTIYLGQNCFDVNADHKWNN